MYKNFPEAIARLKDGTFEEYRAVMNWGDSGEETATTVAYSDPPSDHHQSADNKGKGKVPAYSTPSDPVPLFCNTAIDDHKDYHPHDSSDGDSDASGDAFFLSSHTTSAPKRYSMRLANKNPSHTSSFDPLSSTSDTLLKTVVARARATQTATTSTSTSATTSTSASTSATATTSTSNKRLRTPSPTPDSNKRRHIMEGTLYCSF